jgi:hypothetical protein
MLFSVCALASANTECHRSRDHYAQLLALSNGGVEVVSVFYCTSYLNVRLKGDAKYISQFMKSIEEGGYGKPQLNMLDGNSNTISNMRVILPSGNQDE